ncbi:MAG: heme ABC transporter ATP-binding protein [Pseudomonadota bacterium]
MLKANAGVDDQSESSARECIEAEQVCVTLNHTAILKGIDFSARAGELTAIVGPNGSGKSTLLKALTGDVHYEGNIRLNGNDVTVYSGRALANRRAVLAQYTPVAFPFTVYEVVRFGLLDRSMPDPEQLILGVLDRVGLSDLAGRTYQVLSGGEQQRTQLARILLQSQTSFSHSEPRWLFLDEPVASLDIKHQLEVMDIARDFARESGGVVCVMHDLNLTAMFADSVAVIRDGRVLAQGAPSAVLTDPVLSAAYDCALRVNKTPSNADTYLLPHTCRSS